MRHHWQYCNARAAFHRWQYCKQVRRMCLTQYWWPTVAVCFRWQRHPLVAALPSWPLCEPNDPNSTIELRDLTGIDNLHAAAKDLCQQGAKAVLVKTFPMPTAGIGSIYTLMTTRPPTGRPKRFCQDWRVNIMAQAVVQQVISQVVWHWDKLVTAGYNAQIFGHKYVLKVADIVHPQASKEFPSAFITSILG